MTPLLSVIVPIYNTAQYLHQCLSSIQQQTYTNLQVIMVDDGSTDHSAQIAQSFTSDPRFYLIKQSNSGVSAARNRAIHEAKGEWITFVDSDDFLQPEHYNSIITKHNIEDCDLIIYGYTETAEDSINIGQRLPKSPYQFVTPWTRIIKRQFIEHNHLEFEEGMRYEDVLFAIDTWLAQPNILLTNITSYNYRIHNNSFTAQRHPIKPLFCLIHQHLKQHNPSLHLRLIITYTRLRLLFHFILNRR